MHLDELMQPARIAYIIFAASSRSIREVTICADQYWKDKMSKTLDYNKDEDECPGAECLLKYDT